MRKPRLLKSSPRIRPERYVWHLSNTRNRSSIEKHGLVAAYSGRDCVFANNQSYSYFDLFPVLMWDENYRWKDPANWEPWLDYWRIDTHKCKARWYIDPVMEMDREIGTGNIRDYICTPDNIPVDCIERFYFYPWLWYLGGTLVLSVRDGVTHAYTSKLPLIRAKDIPLTKIGF